MKKGTATKQLTSCLIGLGFALAGSPGIASGIPQQPSPAGAKAYIISPTDGATVSSPVTVRFGLSGMGVSPAGIPKANTGHHHLLVNKDNVDLSKPLGADVKHFGGGQTETALELPVGTHTLQLVLGDFAHIPHDPPVMSEKITITVK